MSVCAECFFLKHVLESEHKINILNFIKLRLRLQHHKNDLEKWCTKMYAHYFIWSIEYNVNVPINCPICWLHPRKAQWMVILSWSWSLQYDHQATPLKIFWYINLSTSNARFQHKYNMEFFYMWDKQYGNVMLNSTESGHFFTAKHVCYCIS